MTPVNIYEIAAVIFGIIIGLALTVISVIREGQLMGRSKHTEDERSRIVAYANKHGSKMAGEKFGMTAAAVRGLRNRWRYARAIGLDMPAKQHIIPIKNGNGNGHSPALAAPIPVLLRAAVFDIETTDFGTEGYEGHLVCCCVLSLDAEKPTTLRLGYDDMDDGDLLKRIICELSRYDILIGHNVADFDLTWLSSRAAYHHMPPLRRWFVIDTLKWARTLKLKTYRSLGNLIDYFRIPDVEKTAVLKTSWSHIRSHFEDEFNKAMEDITYHCEQDVLANRVVLYHLWPHVMASRYSSSSPIMLFAHGTGASVPYYEEALAGAGK